MNKKIAVFTFLTGLSLTNFLQAQTTDNLILTETIESYIEKQGSGFDDTKYKVAEIDLNGDNQKDALVFLIGSYWCGTGGCSMLVLQGTNNGYRLISDISLVREPVIVSKTQTNGWRDIIIHNSGGGLPAKDVALKFDGTTYPTNPSTLSPTFNMDGVEVFSEP